eukprot:CAMPEP_0184487088 /NCGR_PEP_ID=MMETSP0113_2-20130426/9190_1 /TAXON_ID=91329 /ORGANISM="Norrisiella sphaerica, Strain BC52" /LENGTH=147 /DNA_ID=CAMNT_0026869259 /DNA_START=188 /DNA_END=632 /DNA_ORIENTATION=-
MPRTFLPIKPGTLEDWASVDDSSDSLSIEEEHSQQSELDDEMDEVSTAEDSASVPVWLLKCDSCHADLNNCGMLVHLVSDEAVTLYSSSEEGEVEEKGDENKFDTCDAKYVKLAAKPVRLRLDIASRFLVTFACPNKTMVITGCTLM